MFVVRSWHDPVVAYDEELADRVRAAIGDDPAVTETKMFGGLAILYHGNMAVAVRSSGGLMVRVAPHDEEAALTEPGASVAVMRGRPMNGWIVVPVASVAKAADLRRWVARGIRFAKSLPPK